MTDNSRRGCALILGGLLLLLLGGVVVSAVSNLFLPVGSEVVDRLDEKEKALLAETFHLRETLGEEAWPGWSEATIPLVVYNEAYAFLIGYPGEPDEGWTAVPAGTAHGGLWEMVPGDTFLGRPYYRVPLPADGTTPQAFTVRVGDEWAGALQTREWMRVAFIQELGEQLPSFLQPIVPYRLVSNLFLGGSDKYIAALLHEAFHAFQGIRAPQRLAAAERALRRYEERYPFADEGFQDSWQVELELLADALEAEAEAEVSALAAEFLQARAARREAFDLSPALVGYERHREWVEGVAKYMELEMWRLAATAPGYEPHPATEELADLDDYDRFATAWSREVDQIRRMAGDDGDGRFYYSGMAQAVLLDRLAPGWKARLLNEEATLDQLLSAAVQDNLPPS